MSRNYFFYKVKLLISYITTFGCPRVGNKKFAEFFNE